MKMLAQYLNYFGINSFHYCIVNVFFGRNSRLIKLSYSHNERVTRFNSATFELPTLL